MINKSIEQPQYIHDCTKCIYLGREKNDLYFCEQSINDGTVIARFSDRGPDYISGMIFALNGLISNTESPLVEALRRAIKYNLLKLEVKKV